MTITAIPLWAYPVMFVYSAAVYAGVVRSQAPAWHFPALLALGTLLLVLSA